MPHSDIVQTLTTTALTTALALTISLPLLQMDAVSRKVLSSDRLRSKRRSTQVYEMDKAVEIQRLRNKAVVQAAAMAAKESTANQSSKMDGSTWRYNPKEDRLATTLLSTQEEYEKLVKRIMDKKLPSPYITAIDKDDEDGLDKREIYLWLAFPPASGDYNTEKDSEEGWERVQVPLIPVANLLAEAFDNQITSTALCFITDASSGLSSEVLHHIMDSDDKLGALVKEPSWMVVVARILQRNIIQKENVGKILFALTRLEAWRLRNRVGISRTVLFTLPGQAVTPTFLPLLYKAFPHERHVFAYDTCFESVARGLMLRKTTVKLSGMMLPGGIGSTSAAGNSLIVDEALRMPSWVTSSAPISQLKSIRKLGDALADLPADQAGIIEAWMASIDAFLMLKEEERTNNYTPFVCRMGFIMGRTGLGNLASDKVEELNELALINLLQYVTGSRSRPLKDETVVAAKKALEEIKSKCVDDSEPFKQFSHDEKKLLEACCFLHHGILIGDKTLMDTVQPQKEWSLKAARKLQSCACCDPEEEEEEDEDDINTNKNAGGDSESGKVDMTMPGAFAMGLNKRPNASASGGKDAPAAKKKQTGYVDGSRGAGAFDLSKFG